MQKRLRDCVHKATQAYLKRKSEILEPTGKNERDEK